MASKKHIEDQIAELLISISDSQRSTFLVKLNYGSVEVKEVDNNLVADIHGNICEEYGHHIGLQKKDSDD